MKSFVTVLLSILASVFFSSCATTYTTTSNQEVPERWAFSFDSRQWRVGHQAANRQEEIREYVLNGQTVQDWSELVTSHYFARDIAPRVLFEQFRRQISQGCPSLRVSMIEESSDTIIFEWQRDGCQGFPAQHEIRRIA